jgi:hypothetical protein
LAQRDVRGREARSARAALQATLHTKQHSSVVITSATSIAATVWLPGWEDAEVVDSMLVEEPPVVPGSDGTAVLYTRFGRRDEAARYGRLVSVLA